MGGAQVVDEALVRVAEVLSATLPSTIPKIDEWAFSEASGLQRVNILESVTELGSSAFQGCVSLREVTVLSKIKSLKTFVFNMCENLTTVMVGNRKTGGVPVRGRRLFYDYFYPLNRPWPSAATKRTRVLFSKPLVGMVVELHFAVGADL